MTKFLRLKFPALLFVTLLIVISASSYFVSTSNAAITSNTLAQTNPILGMILGPNMTIYSTQINSQTNTQNNGLSQNKIDFPFFQTRAPSE